MHELSVMSSILNIVLDHANKNNADKVIKINLKIGHLSDIIPEWAQNYFDMLSKDTIADGAELSVEHVPVKLRCLSCGHEHTFEKKDWSFTCVKCGSSEIELLEGREFFITSIEIM
ncbi:MAG: hydrogenase maturation nickel metallochaperone HypA [Spirochaetes bacterium RBG_13_51_14]|nr:MAG: hydrogenase maturation nickel metallochaperone HypA [Spirochaetes bacterium RBG_13_51_14]